MKSTIFLSYSLWILIFASCSTPQTSNEPIPAEANHSDKIEAIKLAETSQSWNGDSLPPYLEGTPKVTILKVKIPPKMELKLHKHNEINAGVLLKGEVTVFSETNDTLHLKAGDPIVELVNKWHYGKNTGTETAEFIVFYAGVEGVPITVLKEDEN